MTPDDLARLHAACFTLPRPWSSAAFAGLLASPGVFCLGDATGFLLGRTIADEAEILTLAVDPGDRRRGIGRALVATFAREAKRRGATRAFLEVAATNDAAIGLYEAAGFVRSGVRRGYFRAAGTDPVDALVLSRAL